MLQLLYDDASALRIPQMSDFSTILREIGASSALALIQVPPERPGVRGREAPRPGPVFGAHAQPDAAAKLVEVVVKAAGALANHKFLAHGLEVFPGQLPTVSHASSSRRKGTGPP